MIDRDHGLSISQQTKLLGINPGSVYYLPRPTSEADLALIHRIDELHLEYPVACRRMLKGLLQAEGHQVGLLHVSKLMKKMAIEALYRRPNTSKRAPSHKVYPYLLRNLAVTRPNQVRAIDITSLGVIDLPRSPPPKWATSNRRVIMERFFAGLDVSKDETAICVRCEDGTVVIARKTSTDPDAILEVLKGVGSNLVRVILETGRMANWLHGELARRDLPVICVDARQTHAVLSQMHNKTDANDAAMLADLARTGFFRKVEVKSRRGQELRALLAAREAAIEAAGTRRTRSEDCSPVSGHVCQRSRELMRPVSGQSSKETMRWPGSFYRFSPFAPRPCGRPRL